MSLLSVQPAHIVVSRSAHILAALGTLRLKELHSADPRKRQHQERHNDNPRSSRSTA